MNCAELFVTPPAIRRISEDPLADRCDRQT